MIIKLPAWLGGPVRVQRLAALMKRRYHDVLIDYERRETGPTYYVWKAYLINSPKRPTYIAATRGTTEEAYGRCCDEAYMWCTGSLGAGAVRFHHTGHAMRRLLEVERDPCDTMATMG